jgi:hypothetical protein
MLVKGNINEIKMEHGTWSIEYGTWNMEHRTWSMEHGSDYSISQRRSLLSIEHGA